MLTDIPEAESRDAAKRLCWKVGVLDYRRRNTQAFIQQEVNRIRRMSRGRKIYLETTRRLGKSSELLMRLSELCIQKPDLNCGFFAPIKEGLKDYIEPIIDKTYDDCPEEDRPQYIPSRFMLQFANGSRIIFRASNNQQHRIRRGQEFHEVGIDEARDVDDLGVLIESVLMPALFDTGGRLYISSTPASTRSHPLFHYRQQAQAEGWLISLTIWQAHALDPEVYTKARIQEWRDETLKSVDGADVWAREYECQWVVNKSRAAVPEWNDSYAVDIKPDPFYPFYRHYIAVDWGYTDFTALVFGTYHFRSAKLALESELAFSGSEVRSDRIADAVARQAVKLWGPDWEAAMVSDSADPILINELNAHPRMSFVPVHKANTLDAMLNQFRLLVGAGRLVVSPRCALTLHGLANGVWDEKRAKLDQDAFARHFDHLMAAVYMTRVLDMSSNPIPAKFMIDDVNVIDLDFDKRVRTTQDAKAFEEAFQSAQRRF